jgi:hypothetical protein
VEKQKLSLGGGGEMSSPQAFYPIVSALVKAEEIIGPNRAWVPQNAQQETFLEGCFSQIRGEVLGIDVLTSGYDCSKEWEDVLRLSIWGTLDLLVKWLVRGGTVTIQREDQEYDGVWLGVEGAGVGFLQAEGHPHPIVRIPTQSKDVVYMTILDGPPDPLQLTVVAGSLLEKPTPMCGYGGVRFPMVDLRHGNDVRWLVGMGTTSEVGLPAWIDKASQETRLRMNEVGAHVRSEFRGDIIVTAAMHEVEPDYIIDRPFLLVFQREGLQQPLAVLYITEDDWKNPGTLDFE